MGRPATLKIDIVADAKGANKGIRETESRFDKLGAKLGKWGKRAALGAFAGVAAGAGAMAFASVKAASEMQQAFGAVESIFGKSAKTVEGFANSAATSVGLAKSEYANMAAVLGSQMQRFGQSQAESAKSTDKLIRLGADLAATYGGSVSDAVSAVSSLLRGERDPIERYAVGINQAAISSEVASKGLGKLEGKAKTQAEAQATLKLLFDQTKNAQGQFGRESNTLAGQQERLRAQFENLKTTLGNKLLPVLSSLLTWFSDKVLPAAKRLGAEIAQRLGPTIVRLRDWIVNTAIPALRDFLVWFRDKIVPYIKQYVINVINGLRDAFAKVKKALDDNSDSIETTRDWLVKLGEKVKWAAEKAAPFVAAYGDDIGNTLSGIGWGIGIAIDNFSNLVRTIEGAVHIIERLADAIRGTPLEALAGPLAALFSTGTLTVGRPPLVTGMPLPSPAGLGGMVTAAVGGVTYASSVTGRTRSARAAGGGGVTVNVNVTGALDPVAVARQIERVLRDASVRLGRAPAYGLA